MKWYTISDIDVKDKEEQSIAWNAEDTYQ